LTRDTSSRLKVEPKKTKDGRFPPSTPTLAKLSGSEVSGPGEGVGPPDINWAVVGAAADRIKGSTIAAGMYFLTISLREINE
jgi:hypothetical protein